MTGLEFRRALRTDLKYRYTSYGCYPLFLLLTDGATLCWTCAHEERAAICRSAITKSNDGWRPAGVQVNWEDQDLYCDNCSAGIEAAYPNDRAES